MADEDLEWGSYVNLLQTIHSLTPDVVNDFAPLFPDSFGLAANSSTAKLLKEPRQQENSPRDDSIIEVPRQQLEQLMRLWTEIFQKSLATIDTRSMQIATDISVGLPKTGKSVQAIFLIVATPQIQSQTLPQIFLRRSHGGALYKSCQRASYKQKMSRGDLSGICGGLVKKSGLIWEILGSTFGNL